MPASRNFHTDFVAPAIAGLSNDDAARVAVALDAAIAFGALEHATGNASLADLPTVDCKYWDNVRRLQRWPLK